jgi:hypothetical protein
MRERRLIMAVAKKSVAAPDTKSVTKVEETKAAVKAVTPAAPAKAETVKKAEPAKKEAVKKEAVKKETVKKTAAKKEAPAKKAPAKKTELKNDLHIQFDGKSYSEEDILKIAKDVWKYDLKQKAGDLAKVELYVKPEESKVYYVMNKEYTGSFDI